MDFILVLQWPATSEADYDALMGADPRWADVRAAYRSTDGDRYTVVWPETLREFSVS